MLYIWAAVNRASRDAAAATAAATVCCSRVIYIYIYIYIYIFAYNIIQVLRKLSVSFENMIFFQESYLSCSKR